MEEILSLFGFSLGASIGIGAVKSVTDGSRPIVREVFKAGIRAWDTVTSTANSEAVDTAEAERSRARRSGRRRAQSEKIVIAHQ
jgi:diketogulonate reductase-like aldo/keto reductase